MKEQELVTIEPTKAMDVFTAHKGLDPFLTKIRTELDTFKPDTSTSTGRKDIAGIAHRISRSKTYLDGVGKKLVADLKEKPKLIDKERKRVRDILDTWKVEVRKPLTDWEDNERMRVGSHEANYQAIITIRDTLIEGIDSIMILGLQKRLNFIVVDDTWEEFKDKSEILHQDVARLITKKLEARIKYEDEQDELDKLRTEKQVREGLERDERIAKEAAENAKKEAETKAKREAEKARLREEELKLQAERAEREKVEAATRAKQEKVEAENRVKQVKIAALEKAERDKKAAVEAEKARIEEDRKFKEIVEKERRENHEHIKQTNDKALKMLIQNGIPVEVGTKIITLAAQNKLGPLQMSY